MSAAVVLGVTLLALISSAGCAPSPPQPQQQASAASTVPASAMPTDMLPCNGTFNSGSEGVTHHLHDLGDTPGRVKVKYNLYTKPDDIKIIYRGQVIGSTGGPRSGRGEISFDWSPVAGDHAVDVVVTRSAWGTRWSYSIGCPVAGGSQ
jgi:hypothetical protein